MLASRFGEICGESQTLKFPSLPITPFLFCASIVLGAVKSHRDVLLMVAVISRYEEAFEWAKKTMEQQWGSLALVSDAFLFDDTTYYTKSMGTDLKKAFVAFEQFVDPALLPKIKNQTNDWETDYARSAAHDVPRPLNLDSGYISEAKLVLATTKDRDHRIYLDQGIYAETTLYFRSGRWCEREWTYPDYRREDYQEFFSRCREYLRSRYRQESADCSSNS